MNNNAARVCHELLVPSSVCLVRFSSDLSSTADGIGYTTRNEMVIVHCTVDGRIAYIELVGDDKPCQQPMMLR